MVIDSLSTSTSTNTTTTLVTTSENDLVIIERGVRESLELAIAFHLEINSNNRVTIGIYH